MCDKVIFREEKNGAYLAIFPEDSANLNGYGAIAFTLDSDDNAIFEPYMEVNRNYMLSCKIIHKNDCKIPVLLKTLERYYKDFNITFEVCEKITAKMDQKRTAWIYGGDTDE